MLNEALKKLRLFHNIKQTDLSQKLGISNSYLSEIESGKKLPSVELLNKYSNEFNLPVSSLMYFSENLKNEGKLSKSFRLKSAGLIFKLLDWSNNLERAQKEKT